MPAVGHVFMEAAVLRECVSMLIDVYQCGVAIECLTVETVRLLKVMQTVGFVCPRGKRSA
jgi:hypothetical protein